jgi:oligopeptide transport system ATP-binding protein
VSVMTLLEARGLSKWYVARQSHWRGTGERIEAVCDLSFQIERGGALALVGASGSGKSTTARIIVGLETPSAGTIAFEGLPLSARPSIGERRMRARRIQIVFQNPYLSLDPQQTAQVALEEVLAFHADLQAAERRERVGELLRSVGLGHREAAMRPRQLSGGQAQRVAIARALAPEPQLLILDEAVSALDVSVQAQILNLLLDLRDRLGLATLFISHDLAVVRQISDWVLVMYKGRAVEYGPVDEVMTAPLHPYTRQLLASVPKPGASWVASQVAEEAKNGCRFRSYCPHAFSQCETEPPLLAMDETRKVRCWLHIGNALPDSG